MTSLVDKIDTSISTEIKRDTIMNLKCFNIQFIAGKLTTDKDRLRELFTEATTYNEVLQDVTQQELNKSMNQ